MKKNKEIDVPFYILGNKDFDEAGLEMTEINSNNGKFTKYHIKTPFMFKNYISKLEHQIERYDIAENTMFGDLNKDDLIELVKEYKKEYEDIFFKYKKTPFKIPGVPKFSIVKESYDFLAYSVKKMPYSIYLNDIETKEKYLNSCKMEIAHACKLKKCFWDKDYTKEQIIKNIPHNALTGEPYMKTESIFLLNHKEKNDFKEAIYLTIEEAKEISPNAKLKNKSYGFKMLETDIQSQKIHVSCKTLYNIEQFSGIDRSKIAPKNLESIEKFQESAKDANLKIPLIDKIGLFEKTANDIKRYLEAQVKGLDFAQSKKFAPQEKIAQKYQNNYQKDKSYTNPKTQYHRDKWKAKNSSGREF